MASIRHVIGRADSKVGIIAALEREVRCLAGAPGGPAPISTCGPGPARAKSAAEELLAQGCEALVSFGLAGGLDPALAPGTLVLATEVVPPVGPAFRADVGWRGRLAARVQDRLSFVERPLAGVDEILAGPGEKHETRRATGAAAADMESHAVARAALDAGVPFVALRAVADPAGRALPRAARRAVGPAGETLPAQVLLGLLVRPWEIVALIALARDSNAAFAALRRVAVLTGAGFAF